MQSESNVAVILPDGTLEFGQGHLVNDDVPIVPLHPEVDLQDVFLPEFEKNRDSYLRMLTHDRIEKLLSCGRGEVIYVERGDPLSAPYGNRNLKLGVDYATIRDALAAGQVVNIDGLPWYPVVSENGHVQTRYRHWRRIGCSHYSAMERAHRDVVGEILPWVGPGGRRNGPNATNEKYAEMRLRGESHNMAEMLATRSFPGVKTDAIFNEGRFSGDFGQNGHEQTWLRQQAEAAGVSTTGKWYCRGLASFPGDPTAWVGDRGDVLRVAAAKNMTVHGYVEHKGHEEDLSDQDLPIADDIIESEVADILDSNPFADPEAVREEVYRVRTGAVDNNPLVLDESGADSLNISG